MNAKDVESEIQHWDLGRDVAQTVRLQIDLLLDYTVKSVKNKIFREAGKNNNYDRC